MNELNRRQALGAITAVVQRLAAAVRSALAVPDLASAFTKFAIQPAPSTPEELGRGA